MCARPCVSACIYVRLCVNMYVQPCDKHATNLDDQSGYDVPRPEANSHPPTDLYLSTTVRQLQHRLLNWDGSCCKELTHRCSAYLSTLVATQQPSKLNNQSQPNHPASPATSRNPTTQQPVATSLSIMDGSLRKFVHSRRSVITRPSPALSHHVIKVTKCVEFGRSHLIVLIVWPPFLEPTCSHIAQNSSISIADLFLCSNLPPLRLRVI